MRDLHDPFLRPDDWPESLQAEPDDPLSRGSFISLLTWIVIARVREHPFVTIALVGACIALAVTL